MTEIPSALDLPSLSPHIAMKLGQWRLPASMRSISFEGIECISVDLLTGGGGGSARTPESVDEGKR